MTIFVIRSDGAHFSPWVLSLASPECTFLLAQAPGVLTLEASLPGHSFSESEVIQAAWPPFFLPHNETQTHLYLLGAMWGSA